MIISTTSLFLAQRYVSLVGPLIPLSSLRTSNHGTAWVIWAPVCCGPGRFSDLSCIKIPWRTGSNSDHWDPLEFLIWEMWGGVHSVHG